MKLLMTTLLIVSSFNVSAIELLGMLDGKKAFCESKYDTFRSKTHNVYMPTNPTLKVNETTVEIKINIDFYSCDIINGKFKFSKIDNHMSAVFPYPNVRTGEMITMTRLDKKKEVLALDLTYQIVGLSEILKEGNQSYVTLTIDKSKLEINHFPAAQEKGNYYTTIMLRSLSKIFTRDIDLGFSYVGGRSYRLFLDLENTKASL
ncbi:MAG: hypothetical protein ACJAS4_000533 [Bacteriovoracaceae bacterium]|jgi:hypothetical protein